MTEEIWKDIAGYEGKYNVVNVNIEHGEVISGNIKIKINTMRKDRISKIDKLSLLKDVRKRMLK